MCSQTGSCTAGKKKIYKGYYGVHWQNWIDEQKYYNKVKFTTSTNYSGKKSESFFLKK